MGFLKGIRATKIVHRRPDMYWRQAEWWEEPPIDDVSILRPKPKKDVLLIVGDASGVIKDIADFLDFSVDFDTMAINYSPKIIPWDLQHFIAGDSHMKDMQAVAKSLKNGCIKHCWNPNSVGFDVRWIRNSSQGWNGTTANLGIRIALVLGYTRIVLAGIPMDNTGNWYKNHIPKDDKKQGKDHTAHLWKWTEIATRPVSRFIKSMSGNTADMFGKPDKDWLTFNYKESKNADASRN